MPLFVDDEESVDDSEAARSSASDGSQIAEVSPEPPGLSESGQSSSRKHTSMRASEASTSLVRLFEEDSESSEESTQPTRNTIHSKSISDASAGSSSSNHSERMRNSSSGDGNSINDPNEYMYGFKDDSPTPESRHSRRREATPKKRGKKTRHRRKSSSDDDCEIVSTSMKTQRRSQRTAKEEDVPMVSKKRSRSKKSVLGKRRAESPAPGPGLEKRRSRRDSDAMSLKDKIVDLHALKIGDRRDALRKASHWWPFMMKALGIVNRKMDATSPISKCMAAIWSAYSISNSNVTRLAKDMKRLAKAEISHIRALGFKDFSYLDPGLCVSPLGLFRFKDWMLELWAIGCADDIARTFQKKTKADNMTYSRDVSLDVRRAMHLAEDFESTLFNNDKFKELFEFPFAPAVAVASFQSPASAMLKYPTSGRNKAQKGLMSSLELGKLAIRTIIRSRTEPTIAMALYIFQSLEDQLLMYLLRKTLDRDLTKVDMQGFYPNSFEDNDKEIHKEWKAMRKFLFKHETLITEIDVEGWSVLLMKAITQARNIFVSNFASNLNFSDLLRPYLEQLTHKHEWVSFVRASLRLMPGVASLFGMPLLHESNKEFRCEDLLSASLMTFAMNLTSTDQWWSVMSRDSADLRCGFSYSHSHRYRMLLHEATLECTLAYSNFWYGYYLVAAHAELHVSSEIYSSEGKWDVRLWQAYISKPTVQAPGESCSKEEKDRMHQLGQELPPHVRDMDEAYLRERYPDAEIRAGMQKRLDAVQAVKEEFDKKKLRPWVRMVVQCDPINRVRSQRKSARASEQKEDSEAAEEDDEEDSVQIVEQSSVEVDSDVEFDQKSIELMASPVPKMKKVSLPPRKSKKITLQEVADEDSIAFRVMHTPRTRRSTASKEIDTELMDKERETSPTMYDSAPMYRTATETGNASDDGLDSLAISDVVWGKEDVEMYVEMAKSWARGAEFSALRAYEIGTAMLQKIKKDAAAQEDATLQLYAAVCQVTRSRERRMVFWDLHTRNVLIILSGREYSIGAKQKSLHALSVKYKSKRCNSMKWWERKKYKRTEVKLVSFFLQCLHSIFSEYRPGVTQPMRWIASRLWSAVFPSPYNVVNCCELTGVLARHLMFGARFGVSAVLYTPCYQLSMLLGKLFNDSAKYLAAGDQSRREPSFLSVTDARVRDKFEQSTLDDALTLYFTQKLNRKPKWEHYRKNPHSLAEMELAFAQRVQDLADEPFAVLYLMEYIINEPVISLDLALAAHVVFEAVCVRCVHMMEHTFSMAKVGIYKLHEKLAEGFENLLWDYGRAPLNPKQRRCIWTLAARLYAVGGSRFSIIMRTGFFRTRWEDIIGRSWAKGTTYFEMESRRRVSQMSNNMHEGRGHALEHVLDRNMQSFLNNESLGMVYLCEPTEARWRNAVTLVYRTNNAKILRHPPADAKSRGYLSESEHQKLIEMASTLTAQESAPMKRISRRQAERLIAQGKAAEWIARNRDSSAVFEWNKYSAEMREHEENEQAQQPQLDASAMSDLSGDTEMKQDNGVTGVTVEDTSDDLFYLSQELSVVLKPNNADPNPSVLMFYRDCDVNSAPGDVINGCFHVFLTHLRESEILMCAHRLKGSLWGEIPAVPVVRLDLEGFHREFLPIVSSIHSIADAMSSNTDVVLRHMLAAIGQQNYKRDWESECEKSGVPSIVNSRVENDLDACKMVKTLMSLSYDAIERRGQLSRYLHRIASGHEPNWYGLKRKLWKCGMFKDVSQLEKMPMPELEKDDSEEEGEVDDDEGAAARAREKRAEREASRKPKWKTETSKVVTEIVDEIIHEQCKETRQWRRELRPSMANMNLLHFKLVYDEDGIDSPVGVGPGFDCLEFVKDRQTLKMQRRAWLGTKYEKADPITGALDLPPHIYHLCNSNNLWFRRSGFRPITIRPSRCFFLDWKDSWVRYGDGRRQSAIADITHSKIWKPIKNALDYPIPTEDMDVESSRRVYTKDWSGVPVAQAGIQDSVFVNINWHWDRNNDDYYLLRRKRKKKISTVDLPVDIDSLMTF